MPSRNGAIRRDAFGQSDDCEIGADVFGCDGWPIRAARCMSIRRLDATTTLRQGSDFFWQPMRVLFCREYSAEVAAESGMTKSSRAREAINPREA